MRMKRYPCGERYPEYSREEESLGIPEFMNDRLRIRMDVILRYFWKKGGKTSIMFHKWRVKYLAYIEAKYPLLYNQPIQPLVKMESKRIEFAVTKKHPKPDAPSYIISTMQDMADCVTSENVDRFLHEFELVIRSIILLKATADSIAIEKGDVNKEKILFPQYTWIDD